MFNPEQLAAIAAAVSILQQSNLMQSNPTSNASQNAPPPPPQPQPRPIATVNHPTVTTTATPAATTSNSNPRPISYSAIVAKAAGLSSSANNTHANVTTTSVNNDNIMSGTNGGHVPPELAYGPFGYGLNQMISANPESMSNFNNTNGTSSINGHASRPTTSQQQQHQHHHQQQQQQHLVSSNSIVRNALNNHVVNNPNIDIFNTNSLTSGSLAQTYGSSLLMQRNSNNLLSLEPTLDGYHSDYPISPAQQLFNQQNISFRHNQVPTLTYNHQQNQNQNNNHSNLNTDIKFNTNPRDKGTPTYGRATNLLGFMGLYVGNLSPELSKEQLEKIFSKYGEPVKAHRLIRSPVAFIKYENTESPRAAIDDLYGILLPELTLNPDQPLKLHFDRNDAQLKANYRPTELPKEDNGECYGWRTTVCKRGKSCPKKHIPINRGIDFQMWMIKSSSTSTATGATNSTVTPPLIS